MRDPAFFTPILEKTGSDVPTSSVENIVAKTVLPERATALGCLSVPL